MSRLVVVISSSGSHTIHRPGCERILLLRHPARLIHRDYLMEDMLQQVSGRIASAALLAVMRALKTETPRSPFDTSRIEQDAFLARKHSPTTRICR